MNRSRDLKQRLHLIVTTILWVGVVINDETVPKQTIKGHLGGKWKGQIQDQLMSQMGILVQPSFVTFQRKQFFTYSRIFRLIRLMQPSQMFPLYNVAFQFLKQSISCYGLGALISQSSMEEWQLSLAPSRGDLWQRNQWPNQGFQVSTFLTLSFQEPEEAFLTPKMPPALNVRFRVETTGVPYPRFLSRISWAYIPGWARHWITMTSNFAKMPDSKPWSKMKKIWLTVWDLDSTSLGVHFFICKWSWTDCPPPWALEFEHSMASNIHLHVHFVFPFLIHLHAGKQSAGTFYVDLNWCEFERCMFIKVLIKLHLMCKNPNPSKFKKLSRAIIISRLAGSELSTMLHYRPLLSTPVSQTRTGLGWNSRKPDTSIRLNLSDPKRPCSANALPFNSAEMSPTPRSLS